MAGYDMLVPYLRQILGFIGITDIDTIRAEAQSFGSAMEQVAVVARTVHAAPQVGP
ncbi:NAD(P)H-dependent oxidoreductase [Bradyrhizobium sp. 21]|uniref:NAD(P)H-dependent oxidoreductase n=1 Tax=Bradyrhizobium sp. 21 TaxID=2782666 RepID=UPI001FF9936B|nr:NAD(P)H-dependent oxidoreductase [Bradyrhizobium sp. 21]MCK1385046.1 NAD(P)H-dependent oxidoreductase [Bradyrhizobium sp. 21]